jgi:hypothetical protein
MWLICWLTGGLVVMGTSSTRTVMRRRELSEVRNPLLLHRGRFSVADNILQKSFCG